MDATTVGRSDLHDDDDIDDDNISDEDEWLKRTEHITSKCPHIPQDGVYCHPQDFHPKHVEYGDGGDQNLEYPIWVCGALSKHISGFGTNVREELVEVFHRMNEERQDFHKYPLPVEDIIDPDLLVCKPVKPISPLPSPTSSSDNSIYQDNIDFKRFNKLNFNRLTLRGSYQWIPSEFRICYNVNNDYDVHIETPICHLPMTEEYEQTYKNLEKIFAKLVPMFREIFFIDNTGNDTRLQVIVKVQSYNIQPGKYRREKKLTSLSLA